MEGEGAGSITADDDGGATRLVGISVVDSAGGPWVLNLEAVAAIGVFPMKAIDLPSGKEKKSLDVSQHPT